MNLRVRVYLGSLGFQGGPSVAGGTGDAQVQDDGAVGPDGRHERPEDGGLSCGTVPKVAVETEIGRATSGTFVDNLFTTRYNCKKRVFRGTRGGWRPSYVNLPTVCFLFAPTLLRGWQARSAQGSQWFPSSPAPTILLYIIYFL